MVDARYIVQQVEWDLEGLLSRKRRQELIYQELQRYMELEMFPIIMKLVY